MNNLELSEVDLLREENRRLKEQLVKQDLDIQNDQRDLFFARVLGSGYYKEATVLRDAGKKFNMSFPNPDFAVIICRKEDISQFGKSEKEYKILNFILRNTFENCFDIPCYAAEVKENIVGLLNLEACDEIPESILSVLSNSINTVSREYRIELTVSVSRVYHSPLELNHAARDAEQVLDYLDVLGLDQRVTAYDSLTHQHLAQTKRSFLEFQTQLLGCARICDVEGIRKLMHEIIVNELFVYKPTVDTFKFRMYGIVNTMLYLLEELRDSVPQSFFENANPGHRLTHAETFEDLLVTLDDILIQLEQSFNASQTSIAPLWGEQIRDYILQEYHDPNLTVASLADYFNITPTYCSRMFKSATNQRLFDFIQLTRLDAAKKLLSSELNLSKIAETCGFSSALTMSRAFKRYEGASPSALREHLK